MLVVICAIVLATGKPACSKPAAFDRAEAYVLLCNQKRPFNVGNPIGPFTLFLQKDQPKDAGTLTLEDL